MIEINKEFKEKLFELKITNRLDKIIRFFNNKENICSEMCGIDECFGIPNEGKFSEDEIESFKNYIDKYVDKENYTGNYNYYDDELKRVIENPTEPPLDCPYWDLIKNIDTILPLLNMMNSNDIFIENSEDDNNENK